MERQQRWMMVAVLCGALLGTETASATQVVYTLTTPPVPASEINATVYDGNGNPLQVSPADSPWPLLASGKMGVKLFNPAMNVTGIDQALFASCKSNSNPNNTWPGQCDFKGMASALGALFPTQYWTRGAYPKGANEQAAFNTAVNDMINGMSIYKSPVLVPLYGKTDHWATVVEVKADKATTPYTLAYVKYFDSGSAGPDPLNPWTDVDFNGYTDGIKIQGASAWRGTYYKILFAPPGCDPYCDQFLVSYEPPPGSKLRQTGGVSSLALTAAERPSSELILGRSPGVLFDDVEEMDTLIAEERVWDALYSAELHQDRDVWDAIMNGHAGRAMPVFAENLEGEAMDYFLVPILDEKEDAIAMVRLSMDDGAFESIWAPTKPMPYMGITPQEAEYYARESLPEGETLLGGVLTWSARRSLGGSELLPYYEFQVVSAKGEFRGRIGVSLATGVVSGLDRSISQPIRVIR